MIDLPVSGIDHANLSLNDLPQKTLYTQKYFCQKPCKDPLTVIFSIDNLVKVTITQQSILTTTTVFGII